MNILVTGATGFIGRHLVSALSKSYSVRCLVRKSSDITTLKDLNVDVTYGDLLVRDSLGPALDGIDLVYHLAGEVYSRKKSDYYKGNVLATQNLLDACKEKGTKRIIFLSSIGVYKPAAKGTLLTEESECEPLTIYGKTKLDAEGLIKESYIPWVIVRAPIIYGPYQPPVVNRLFLNAFIKRKILNVGKGDNPRSLCFIDNLVDGLMLLANKPETNGKLYILSDHSPYAVDEIVTAISAAIGQKVRVVHLPNILGNISWQINKLMGKLFNLYFIELYAMKTMQLHWVCDITKAKKEIRYSPNATLEMGIKSTMDWIKNDYKPE
ncbi:MAG TPA: NAD(P)-dependent oxidoreductase [Syntrophales bacterium]|nr:NAD(P)-dependent oxidoreductase [Syntrophales bacterium]